MIITNNIKQKIQELYNSTPENIHGVSLGYKYIGGAKTNLYSIVFNVDKKISLDMLSDADKIPKTILIDGAE